MFETRWMGAAVLLMGAGCVVLLIMAARLRHQLRSAQRLIGEQQAEHQRVHDRLADNEYRLRTIIESEPECVKLQAADGTVLEINPAGLRLLDASHLSQIVGQNIYRFVAPEHLALYRESMARVFAGESVVYEFRGITLTGRTCWMESHAAPLRNAQGEIHALLGITRNITDGKKAAERARRHQTELARVARLSTMGEMATGIAHELNQPLAAIANFARGCIRRVRAGDTDPNDLLVPLTEVCEQAERAGEILRHVREFVRKRELDLVPVDINQTVRTVAKFVEMEACQHGATVLLDLMPDLPRVQADAIMVEQVLYNLVRNAFEAMTEAHALQRVVSIRTTANAGDRIDIEVSDTGPEVDAVVIEQMFDQFFSTKLEGVGMGLSISRSIIESHGGQLNVHRAQRGGMAFVCALPVSVESGVAHG